MGAGMPYGYGMPPHMYAPPYGAPGAPGEMSARGMGPPPAGAPHRMPPLGGGAHAAPTPHPEPNAPPVPLTMPRSDAHGGPTPTVYLATYSSVPVYEITVRGIALMRRRSDGYLNATQILKIAGVEKARRTRILEKEILTGEHDKVQGGFGTFQGTWIPLKRAQELATAYSVYHLIRPLLEFDPASARAVSNTPYARRKPTPAEGEDPAAAAAAAAYSPAYRAPSTPHGQQPRFLSLRPPSGAEPLPPGGLIPPPLPADEALQAPGTQGVPPGSKPGQKHALGAYAAHGYTPQGVPLPAKEAPEEERAEKRARTEAPAGAPAEPPAEPPAGAPAGAPSPVRDLNALGPAGGSLRAAATRAEPAAVAAAAAPADAGPSAGDGPRFSDKALAPTLGDERERHMREVLTGLFVDEAQAPGGAEPGAALERLLGEMGAPPGGAGVNLVIDDHGHTALHWASALCRLPLVRMLTALPPARGGANICAGNYAGETALQRAVLVTNSYETSQFAELLELLDGSLQTRDQRKRTVLHHIALVAGLKGRAAPARYYLGCVLDRLAARAAPGLLDAQDEEGETALNIAARLGNTNMIKMLLDAGARKDLPNYLGITPIDWGITGIGNETPGGSGPSSSATPDAPRDAVLSELASVKPADVVKSFIKPPAGPVQKSQDVREKLTQTLEELQSIFDREVATKQGAIETTQTHLQAATRELAARRKHVAAAQAAVAERDEARHKGDNLARALAEARGGDGPSDAPAEPPRAPLAAVLGELDAALAGDAPPAALVRARWASHALGAQCAELDAALARLSDASRERELRCRRVVAMCAHVPVDKVDRMLDELLVAVESIGQDVDIGTVANFMQKVGRTTGAAGEPVPERAEPRAEPRPLTPHTPS